ncbi:MAG: DNA mismatch repair protein MutS, partial [Alphaproteobacteria bacterium]|nr:DNA mismatch repair protein MutS [Alphaproteobacteria bacterium]
AIPMCGVPFHAYEIYLARLIKAGYKVAICEQMENPEDAKKRGAKSVVRREVVRLVTAGTITEESLLDAKRNNYIVSVCTKNKELGVAWFDISTGAFYMQHQDCRKIPSQVLLANILERLSPEELLVEDKLLAIPEYYSLLGEYREKLSVLPKTLFNLYSATNTLLKAYKLQTIDTFGDFSEVELIAAGVLLEYVCNTQKGNIPRLKMPQRILSEAIMEIDASTRRSLELINPISSGGLSLLKVIDKTVTGIGGRLLASRLSAPTLDLIKINNRLDAVSFFVDNPGVRKQLRHVLHQCMDMERAVQRLSLGHGGPKDLYDLATTFKTLPYLKNIVLSFGDYQPDSVYSEVPPALADLVNRFFDHSALQADIEQTLLSDRNQLPSLTRNGGFVRNGAFPDLDYLREIRTNSEQKCEQLRQYYADLTDIPGLKIKNNTVIGYFIEVPRKSAEKMLNDPLFIHRQSVLNAMRFTTTELSQIEDEVNNSEEKALAMELQIFNDLVERVLSQATVISRSASIIAELDVAAAAAELAAEQNYVRPLVDDSLAFDVVEGRHPVVEAAIKHEGKGNFVGNNCNLSSSEDNIWLLTGPNMAGKSTFLRQNALIAILAQIGYFVPAKKAHIGLINKLFSRVGASDDLARGRSTFMVEMVETAAILNRADEHSFVILDEIGRGTATFDGLSIAWAVAEHLSEINKCRTIFATHYHELTKLTAKLKN